MSRRRVIRRAHPRGASGGGRAPWPTWDAADGTMGLRTGAGAWPAFDAVVGGWLACIWWQNAVTSNRYLLGNGPGSVRGWVVFSGTPPIWRVFDAVGATQQVSPGNGAVLGRFNAALMELDIGASEIAITLNNGTRATAPCVGHTPSDAADRFAVDSRQLLTSGVGTDAGVHAVAGAGGDVLTATQRLAFWATFARLRGMGDYGQPPGGVETLGNPAAQHKWVAHELACRVAGTLLAKAGTVVDAFHPAVLAF